MMLLIFACIACLFFLMERIFQERKQPVFRRGFFTDMFYIPIHYLMRVIVNGTLAVAVLRFSQRVLPESMTGVTRNQPVWVQALFLLFTLDFFFYVMHRLKHRWHWWWRLHETHHSSVDMDFLASVRFHPLEKLLDRVIYLLPLTLIGPSEQAVLIWASVDVFFGMFIHSNTRLRLGPLIYFFVGPEMHRWHHAKDPAVRECNFGNNFSIFDWIFRTAYLSPQTPCEFGVDDRNYPVNNIFKQFFFAFRPYTGQSAIKSDIPSPVDEEKPAMSASKC